MIGAKACLALVLASSGASAALADTPRILTEETWVKTGDPGVEVYVRNKHPDGLASHSPDRTLIYIHGATYPSDVTFDLPINGVSMMDLFAQQGFDVYLVDVHGYGKSSHAPQMDQPPEANPPFSGSVEANKDLGAAFDYVLKKSGVPKADLMGWSWGTSIAGNYTAQHNDQVNRLVLYAPAWTFDPPKQPDGKPIPAYRTVTRDDAWKRWYKGVPEDKKATLIEPGVFDQWWTATLANDPAGARMTPPVLHAPNGILEEFTNTWVAGKPYYNPEDIKVPTLLIHAEWDADLPSYMARAYFAKLANAPYKRFVEIGEGTHSVMLEKNRMQFFREILNFLTEPGPAASD